MSAVVADLAASELHDSLRDLEQLHQEGKGGELGVGAAGGGVLVAKFYDCLYGPERLLSKHLLTALQWATADG